MSASELAGSSLGPRCAHEWAIAIDIPLMYCLGEAGPAAPQPDTKSHSERATNSAEDQDVFVAWLEPLAAQQMEDLYVTFDTLADHSSRARTLLEQHAPQCSKKRQSEIHSRLLRFTPIDQHPPLASLDKNSQRVLIGFYRQQANHDPEARRRLLQAAELPSKDVALAASKDIAAALDNSVTATDVFPLLRSRIVGVRTNGVAALIDCIEQGGSIAPSGLEQVCQTLAEEDNQTVVRLLFQLINLSARQQPVSGSVLQALSILPSRLVAAKQFEGGTAKSLLDALKSIAQSSTPPESRVPVEVSEYLLTKINLGQLRNGESEMIDLLCAVYRMDAGFLARMVKRHGALFVERGWTYNLMAIVHAAGRVEGKDSAVVERILAAEWCDEAVRGLILESLGH